MKILAIGDCHFQTSDIPDVISYIEKVETLAKAEKQDIIVILGDVLHTHERLHTTPLNLAIEFVQKMSAISPTVVLVGNHDAENNQIFLSKNHWMNCLKTMPNVEVVDMVLKKVISGFNFVFCPYVYPGRFEEALNTSDEDWKDADCIFAHQEFLGCKMGAIISVQGDKWPENYPNVVSGHIHNKQTPQKNIYYCGSSRQIAFGESENNTVALLTWKKPGTAYKLEEKELGLPRKKIIYTDVESIEDLKIPQNADKVKLSITGNYEEFKAFKKSKKYKEITKTGTKIVFKPKKIKVNEKGDETKKEATPDDIDFSKILWEIIQEEKNPHLSQAYDLIIHGK